jgi:hypothetical protein
MEIETHAIAFRHAMERCQPQFKSGLRFFPQGCSSETADLFGRYLLDRLRFETEHVTAWTPIKHSWLQLDDYVLDLLADQHGPKHTSEIDVVVTKDAEFYQRCSVTHRRKAGVFGLPGQKCTLVDYKLILAAMEQHG